MRVNADDGERSIVGGRRGVAGDRCDSEIAGSCDADVLGIFSGSCVASGICGALVPLTLKKYGFDPATASSIFLTTATDVVSMGLLLGLATLLVPIST